MFQTTFADRFVVEPETPAEEVLRATDMALWRLETMRRVRGRDPYLPQALVAAVEEHLLPLAIDLGDLGAVTGAPSVAVRPVKNGCLVLSQWVPIDRSDPPMPAYSSDRVSDGALILLAESLCMQIQVLMGLWDRLASRTVTRASHDPTLIAGVPMPDQALSGTLERYTALARRTVDLVRAVMHMGARADTDHERAPFVDTVTALCELAEGLVLATGTLHTFQTTCTFSTNASMTGSRRLVLESVDMMGAVLECARVLAELRGWAVRTTRNDGLDRRAASWLADVSEMHLIYAFLAFACGARADELNYVRHRALATTRAREQGLRDVFEGVGPFVSASRLGSLQAAGDGADAGVPEQYARMTSGAAPRPKPRIISLRQYKRKLPASQPIDGVTALGCCPYQPL
jgi:hypothetical protein